MRFPKLLRFLRCQEGISLVMAVGVLGVLSVSSTTLIYYSNSNARSAEYSKQNSNAYDLAEAGVAHGLAVLSNSPAPLTPTLLPQTTVQLQQGTATYSGTLSGTVWTITSVGRIANPTAATNDVTRTLTRKATVYGLNDGGTVADWSKMYHDSTTSCLTIEDVTIPVNVASRGGICLVGSGKITGSETRVEAAGNVTMTRSNASDIESPSTGAGWTSSGNIVSSNNSDASATIAAGGTSANLNATNFGFAVPAGSIITGIRAEVERAASAASSIEDFDVYLLKGGAISGSDKAVAGYWGTSDNTRAYGGSNDLWGTTWTTANVNASNFGLRFKVRNGAGVSQTAYVDHVEITVYYRPPLSTSIGTLAEPVDQADIGGTCTYDSQPAHAPCTSTDKVYADPITNTPQNVTKPDIDLPYWYQNAKPGPMQNCTTGSFPGGFDNDTVLNNSRPGAPEVTPSNSSYTCKVHNLGGGLVGEISWNHVTHVLTVHGTIYVDGDFRFDDDGQLVNYQGRAIIYATDDLEFDERVCAGGDGTNDCWANPPSWNPSQNLLTLLTGGDSEFDQGGTMPLQPAAFQGGVYAVGDCLVHEAFRLSGPIICDEIQIPYDSNTWPTFYTFPSLGSLVDGQMYADPYTATNHVVVVGDQTG
jgi:hypothetical protein